MAEAAADAPPAPPPAVEPLDEEEFAARKAIFDRIFESCKPDKAKLASIKERKHLVEMIEDGAEKPKLEARFQTWTYGEAPMDFMHRALNKIKSQHGEGELLRSTDYFVDIGSGAGKACIAAALLHPFEKVIGVEGIVKLDAFAKEAKTKYMETEVFAGDAAKLFEGVTKPEIDFRKADFCTEYEEQLSGIAMKTQVAFVVSSSYGPEQMEAVAKFAGHMPHDAFFITVGKGLPDEVTFSLNRNPKQRERDIVKAALWKRGVCDVEIPPLPLFKEIGWNEVETFEEEFAWGPTVCKIFKKKTPFYKCWADGIGPWKQLLKLDKDEALKLLLEARPDLAAPGPDRPDQPGLACTMTKEEALGEDDKGWVGRVILRYDGDNKICEPVPEAEAARLTVKADIGATQLEVSVLKGFSPGEDIQINLDVRSERNKIVSLEPFELETPLTKAHVKGARVWKVAPLEAPGEEGEEGAAVVDPAAP